MDATLYAIAGAGAGSVFLLARTLIPVKSTIVQRIEDLEKRPVGASPAFMSTFEKLSVRSESRGWRQKLDEAGWYDISPATLLQRMAMGAGVGLLFGIAFLMLLAMYSLMGYIMVVTFIGAGLYMPVTQMNGAIKKRKTAVGRAMPDLLDLLSTNVRAGLSLNAALYNALDVISGPLADEIRETLSQMKVGRSRADALKSMAVRVHQEDLSSATRAIIQAEQLGASLSGVLDDLAVEARQRRMLRAEEIAAQLPVKMIFPMALFMLPALMTMIFGAVIADYLSK